MSQSTVYQPKMKRVMLVRPLGKFHPRNWQTMPAAFEVLKEVAISNRMGRIDSWRFRSNKKAIATGRLDRWAVAIDAE